MGELLRVNTLTHLTYFRRSRLLLAFGLVFVLLGALAALPAMLSASRIASFDALRDIYLNFSEFLIPMGAGLGLLVMSSHLSNRTLKMVFTKPCPPPVWLGSTFLASALVSLLLMGFILICMVAMSLIWHIPVRAGLVFIAVDTWLAAVGMSAYFIFLATIFHPAIAVAFALIFNASLFNYLRIVTHNAAHAAGSGIILKSLEHLFQVLYLIVPMTRAFESKTGTVYSRLRVPAHEWVYLLYALGYTLAVSLLFYLLALFFLQRKRFT